MLEVPPGIEDITGLKVPSPDGSGVYAECIGLDSRKHRPGHGYTYRWLWRCSNCGAEWDQIARNVQNAKEPCKCCSKDRTPIDPELAEQRHLRQKYRRLKYRHIHDHNGDPEKVISWTQYQVLVTESTCAYCGCPPNLPIRDKNGKVVGYNLTVDRIDSSDGYTRENTIGCCDKCNRAKNDMSPEDFRHHVKAMYLHLFGGDSYS